MKNDDDELQDAHFFDDDAAEEVNGSSPPPLEEAEVRQAEAKASSGNEKHVILDDPYIPGQCTTRVTLVISPEDGHEQGPLVFIAASTHEDLPGSFLTCRLNDLALPPQILEAISSVHETLSQRGEEKLAAKGLAVQKKREAEEKEQLRKQKKQVQTRKETEKKKAEEKRANEPTAMDMFAALQ